MLSLSDVAYSSELFVRFFLTALSVALVTGRRLLRDPELGREDERELAPD